jgi:hypothetical protein
MVTLGRGPRLVGKCQNYAANKALFLHSATLRSASLLKRAPIAAGCN